MMESLSDRIQSNLDQINGILADMDKSSARAAREVDLQALLALLLVCLTVIAVVWLI